MTFHKMIKPMVTLALILTLGFTAVTVHAQAGRGKGRLKGIVIDEEGKHVKINFIGEAAVMFSHKGLN